MYYRLGRRLPLALYFFITGITMISIELLPTNSTISIPLSWLGRVGIISCHSIIILYPAELFPTQVRNTAVGMASVSARLGAMTAPHLILMVNITMLSTNHSIISLYGLTFSTLIVSNTYISISIQNIHQFKIS